MTSDCSEAHYFINETLYQRTTYYLGSFYVLWPYVEAPSGIDPMGSALRLTLPPWSLRRRTDSGELVAFFDVDQTVSRELQISLEFPGAGLHDITDAIEAAVGSTGWTNVASGRLELPDGYRVFFRYLDEGPGTETISASFRSSRPSI